MKDGILLLNKAKGITSNRALSQIKRLLGIKKAGHTGSLDPLATGMLPICLGEATKFAHYLLEADKYYRVTAQLGMNTSTGDAEGEVIQSRFVPPLTLTELENVITEFLGKITQIPPMYSAIKHKGKPLYQLARKGIEVDRPPRTVDIKKLTLLTFNSTFFSMDVHCSKGTYIRTLVEDIGERIGCGAFVAELHRTAVTPFQDEKMYTFNELENVESIFSTILPMQSSLPTIPSVTLSTDALYYFQRGQAVTISNLISTGLVQVLSTLNEFIGLGEIRMPGQLSPKRLIKQNNLSTAPSI